MRLNQKQIYVLENVANELDRHVRLGRPYSLTFYQDNEEPLTNTQKERLEEYLADHFHNIWGSTWIHGEAQIIRNFVQCYS